ncbi:MAG: hypothetical protein D6741_19570 [Planctomycetota bacterium]|nr:MAG: hypothetical protein D6741_19570 [Planctomycetota bacterium]
MSSIIKAGDKNVPVGGAVFNFDDMAAKANEYLEGVRKQADDIIKRAKQEAQTIRRQAEQQGRTEAHRSVEAIVERQLQGKLATLLPALKEVVKRIEQSRHEFLRQWEREAVELAGAIAARIIRRELSHQPELALDLVREAIGLAVGSPAMVIRLHPEDYETLKNQVESIVRELAPVAKAEIVPCDKITKGGCRVETDFGVIDQQIEQQIERIVEELTGEF